MDVCCYGCTKIVYKGEVEPIQKFTNTSMTLYMPLEGAFEGEAFFEYDYVPFLKVGGVSFLARELGNKAEEYTSHLMDSVFNTWPLFITALVMAFTAGCVMWVMVSYSTNSIIDIACYYSSLSNKRPWTFIVFRENFQGGRSY